jgi:hypothetical protein
LGIPIMVEPLPYHRNEAGAAALLDDDDALLRVVAVAAGLGSTSSATWLKVPAGRDPARMLATTTLPAVWWSAGHCCSRPTVTWPQRWLAPRVSSDHRLNDRMNRTA